MIKDLFFPEGALHRNAGGLYDKYPMGARIGAGTGATISGILKPFLAPLVAAVGLVAMPILAGVHACRGDRASAQKALKAWAFCPLVLFGTAVFMAVTAYNMPLIASSTLVISICAFSVIFHVRAVMKEPISR